MSLGDAKHEHGTTLGKFPQLYPYVIDHINEIPLQRTLRNDIATRERSRMMGSPDEAQFLGWLAALVGAKKVVEVGVFRGSTTLALALAMGPGAKIYGLDVSEEFAELGKEAWAAAGVTDRIDFRVGSADATMTQLLETEAGQIDLIFIDADKTGYDTYYELGLKLLRPNGVIVVDNVLWDGSVVAPEASWDESTRTIATLNEKIKSDSRVHAVLLPIADGAYMVRKL
jgi:predicted O-methyltransferase YrrM